MSVWQGKLCAKMVSAKFISKTEFDVNSVNRRHNALTLKKKHIQFTQTDKTAK